VEYGMTTSYGSRFPQMYWIRTMGKEVLNRLRRGGSGICSKLSNLCERSQSVLALNRGKLKSPCIRRLVQTPAVETSLGAIDGRK
jgi:hypothetical protein